MKHRFFNLAAALSLLLCVVTVGLWVRSYFRWDTLQTTDKQSLSSLQTSRARIGFTFVRGQVNQDNAGWVFRSVPDHEWGSPWRALFALAPSKFEMMGGGVAVHRRSGKPPHANYRYFVVVLPYWLPCLISAVVPMTRLVADIRRKRRVRVGSCPTCGYDLRATPQRCPECGTGSISDDGPARTAVLSGRPQ